MPAFSLGDSQDSLPSGAVGGNPSRPCLTNDSNGKQDCSRPSTSLQRGVTTEHFHNSRFNSSGYTYVRINQSSSDFWMMLTDGAKMTSVVSSGGVALSW